MRRSGANYQEMFKKVKNELVRKYKAVLMRISREKINKLAHAVADTLADMDNVDFLEDRNSIRLEARTFAGRTCWRRKRKIDAAARQKIESQRNDHPRRLAGVGHPLPEVLQRGSQEAGDLENASLTISRWHYVICVRAQLESSRMDASVKLSSSGRR